MLPDLTRLGFFVSIDRTGKSDHVTSNETRETLAIDHYEVFPLVFSSDPSRHVLFCFLSLFISWLKRLQCKLHLQYVELEKVGLCSTSSCRLLSTGNTRWTILEMHHVLASNHNFLSQVTVSVAGFSFTLGTVSLQMARHKRYLSLSITGTVTLFGLLCAHVYGTSLLYRNVPQVHRLP